jgi:hypothetical protein
MSAHPQRQESQMVGFWHFSDMAFVLDDVRSWGAKRKLSALSEYFAV